MAVNSTYYLDAANLTLATSVYLDLALTLIAPDGFYADGVISREQSAGILLTPEPCPTCGTSCGSPILGSGGQGIYLVNLDTGSTVSNVGAIVIRFDPQSVPDGFRATYDGVVYNKLSSPIDGVHQSTTYGNFTVVGNTASDCDMEGNTTVFPSLIEYLYDGTSFVATGSTQSITVFPGDVSLGASNPGVCVTVIPKPTSTPNNVLIEMLGPCGGTGWDLIAVCPYLLPSFDCSVVGATYDCFIALTETYYFAKVHTSIDALVGLYDYVFEDAYGAIPLAPGFYTAGGELVGGADYFEVDANGIVISLGFC